MVQVLSLQEKQAQTEFKYDQIHLILFSQSQFDNVMQQSESGNASKLIPVTNKYLIKPVVIDEDGGGFDFK